MITDTATGAGLLAAIIAEPESDALRLIYADWLEENGDRVRAEFIRVQVRIAALESTCLCGSCVRRRGGGQHTNGPCAVDQERDVLPDGSSRQAFLRRRERELLEPGALAHLPGPFWRRGEEWGWSQESGDGLDRLLSVFTAIFRRGFVAFVTTTLADWCGRPCGRCGGSGELTQNLWCHHCQRSGRTPGHAPVLVRACPLEKVTLSDREPGDGVAGWHAWGEGDITRSRAWLPTFLFALLPEAPARNASFAAWPTRAAAFEALSAACLAWAHEPVRQPTSDPA